MSVYPEKPTTFEALVAPFDTSIQHVAFDLRDLVKQAFPDFDEHIYGGLAVGNALYSRGGTASVLCGIQPAWNHCKLYVHNVSDLKQAGLKIEGSGKHARHVKVKQLDDENRALLLWLLRQGYERWSVHKNDRCE
ncbi:MAG: DUF1801 domain-containing protein [Cyanobacteria bacterium P01_H01_bin.119]